MIRQAKPLSGSECASHAQAWATRLENWEDLVPQVRTKGGVVIYNPTAVDKGTVFVRQEGRAYFESLK